MKKPTNTKQPASKPSQRRFRMEPLGSALSQVTKAHFRQHSLLLALVQDWSKIVGPELCEFSLPHKIYFPQGKRSGGTLTIKTTGAHALGLQHASPLIIERIATYYGYAAIGQIKLQQGLLPKKPKASSAAARKKLTDSGPSSPIIETIDDPALQAMLKKLEQHFIAKRKE